MVAAFRLAPASRKMERSKAVPAAFILKKRRSGYLSEQGCEPARQVWVGGNFLFMKFIIKKRSKLYQISSRSLCCD
jgi:hypothetical protein